MSKEDVKLGAALYLDAVNSDLPDTLNASMSEAGATDMHGLKRNMAQMSRSLVKSGVIQKDESGGWVENDSAISEMDDKTAAAFGSLYENAVRATEAASETLATNGQAEYLAAFRETHAAKIAEISPKTETRINHEDMDRVIGDSLNLLQAVHDEPANARFIKGLDAANLDDLRTSLSDNNYLMPGENPDRKAELGSQALRGTPDDQEALFHQAAQLVANLDLPESVAPGDTAMMHAAKLTESVKNAGSYEIDVSEADATLRGTPDFNQSDLTRKDANALYEVYTAGLRLADSANLDANGALDTALVRTELVGDVKSALATYDELHVDAALSSGNFEAPGIDSDAAVQMSKGIGWLREAVMTDVASLEISGDATGDPTTPDLESGSGDEGQFDNAFDGDDDRSDAAQQIADDGEDMAAGRYGKSDPHVRVSADLLDEWTTHGMQALHNGQVHVLGQHAGRSQDETSLLMQSQAAFGSVHDAMGADRVQEGPEMSTIVSNTMSRQAWDNLAPDRKEKLNPYRIEGDKGVFAGYTPGAADVAKERVTRFLDNSMVGDDGSPNLAMRRQLRDIATSGRPVVGNTAQEAQAVADYAGRFVAREAEEYRMRTEDAAQKRGITEIDLPAGEVKRFLDVTEKCGDDTPPRVEMSAQNGGSATLSHPEGPRVARTNLGDRLPSEVMSQSETGTSGRTFGGAIDRETLKAAYETGAKTISISMDGERPRGATGKLDQDKQADRGKRKDPEDLVLS